MFLCVCVCVWCVCVCVCSRYCRKLLQESGEVKHNLAVETTGKHGVVCGTLRVIKTFLLSKVRSKNVELNIINTLQHISNIDIRRCSSSSGLQTTAVSRHGLKWSYTRNGSIEIGFKWKWKRITQRRGQYGPKVKLGVFMHKHSI